MTAEHGITEEVSPNALKHDFLQLEDAIRAFVERRLKGVEGNVGRLLAYHLARSGELLWAEVQGGLEDIYATEAALLTEIERQEQR